MRTGRRDLAAMLVGLILATAGIAPLAASAALPAAGDEPIDLAAWKGKVVYVDFWTS